MFATKSNRLNPTPPSNPTAQLSITTKCEIDELIGNERNSLENSLGIQFAIRKSQYSNVYFYPSINIGMCLGDVADDDSPRSELLLGLNIYMLTYQLTRLSFAVAPSATPKDIYITFLMIHLRP